MNDDSLKSFVDDALLTCMADVPEDEVPQWEAKGMKRLNELADNHGAKAVISCVTQSDYDHSFELYWVARAGIEEVAPELKSLLDADDEDARSSAISGLLHLDDPTGWTELEKLVDSIPVEEYSQPLPWYFEDDLELIGSDRALKLLEKMKS